MAGDYLRSAFRLTWPERQPRTPPGRRRRGAFKIAFGHSRDALLRELRRFNTRHVVISSNVPVRQDGYPLGVAREPGDPGIAVYFDRYVNAQWVPHVIACDVYDRTKANLRAIGVTVESLRAIERHGSSTMLEQAFTGFAALPPGPTSPATSSPAEPAWWETLKVAESASKDVVRAAYRELAGIHHPDHGGNASAMARINRAYGQALAALSNQGRSA